MTFLQKMHALSGIITGSWLVPLALVVLVGRSKLGYWPVFYQSEHDPTSLGLGVLSALVIVALLVSFCAVVVWFGTTIYVAVEDNRALRGTWQCSCVAVLSITLVLVAHYKLSATVAGILEWATD